MRTLLFIFALSLSVSARAAGSDLPYQDGDFGCIAKAEADRYVRDFGIDLNSFGGLELCNPAKDTKKLFNDLQLIEKAEFAPDASHNLIRAFVPYQSYYSWMKSETRGMERGNDVPYATAYNSGGYFTMQDGWAALSTLGRVGTVIHEARHTEGYRHYACSHGPYGASSTPGCDTSYSQGGSHAVEMEYYARVVLDAKNLHPVYKSMARLMALGRTNFVFNETPIRKREALLGLARDALGHGLDEERHRRFLDPVEDELEQQRRHGGAFRVVQPVPAAQGFIGAGGWPQASLSVGFLEVFQDGARLGHHAGAVGDHRRLAQWVDGQQFGRGQHGLGVALVAPDLVGNAQLLQQPQHALGAGVVQVVDGDHAAQCRQRRAGSDLHHGALVDAAAHVQAVHLHHVGHLVLRLAALRVGHGVLHPAGAGFGALVLPPAFGKVVPAEVLTSTLDVKFKKTLADAALNAATFSASKLQNALRKAGDLLSTIAQLTPA